MTDATRTAIELARRVAAGEVVVPGTREDFARALAELSQLNEVDRNRIDAGDWFRADNDVECPHCKLEYWRHPHVPGCEWLHRLCSGKLVKL